MLKILNPKRHLLGPGYDTLILGGASILIWLLILICRKYVSFAPITQHLAIIPSTMASLVLLVNYPHFMASYRIAYGQGPSYIKKNWLELILVPILLFAVFVWTFWLIRKGLQIYSELIISLMLDLMFLTVGWHYCKQIFGCMMITARLSDYSISPEQRKILLFHIHTIWIFVFTFVHTIPTTQSYVGFDYTSRIILSKYLLPIWGIAFVGSLIAFFWKVIYVNFKKDFAVPGLQFWVPLVAIYIWWLPYFSVDLFGAQMVPFFHSLQYMAFVHRYESSSQVETSKKSSSFPLVMLGLCVVGFLAFEGVPGLIDDLTETRNIVGALAFFTGSFSVFINIHHYFIDSVIWRMSNGHIIKNLRLEI